MPDRTRLLVVLALALGSALAVLLALAVTPWTLLVLPFLVVGGVAAWRGVGLAAFAAAVAADDDAGRGFPGLHP